MSEQQGVVAIFTDCKGNVIAAVADFDRDGFGGFSKEQAQSYRAKHALNRAVIKAYASEVLAEAIAPIEAARIVERMIDKGAKRTICPIGHDQVTTG